MKFQSLGQIGGRKRKIAVLVRKWERPSSRSGMKMANEEEEERYDIIAYERESVVI